MKHLLALIFITFIQSSVSFNFLRDGQHDKVCVRFEGGTKRKFPDLNDHPNRHLLASDKECGVADPVMGVKKRIIGGEEVKHAEYPWFAGLFDWSGMVVCGGTIINERWVLSAAHCDTDMMMGLRVAEHDVRTKVDCTYEKNGGELTEVCSTFFDYDIEKSFHHPDFTKCQGSSSDLHDIALFRTTRDIKYSRFVRPACLPFYDVPDEDYSIPEFAEKLTVIGLGLTNATVVTNAPMVADVLLKVKVMGIGFDECHQKFRYTRKGYTICAGGIKDKDSCNGDSGGPLMLKEEGKTRIVGAVSYGAADCGKKGVPAVYASVVGHLQWILDTIY